MKQQQILTANITTQFFKFASTGMLGMIGLSLYILADTFFIANGIGPNGITALNIVLPIYNFMIAIAMLIGIGSACFASTEIGMGRSERAKQIYSFAVTVAAVISVLFLALGLIFTRQVLTVFGATDSTYQLASEYYRIVIVFAPMFMLNQVFLAFTRNDNKPQLAMISLLAGSGFNIVMDYVCIYIFGWGMTGAALATAFSPVVGMLVMSTHLLRKKCTYHFHLTKPDWSFVRPILSGGMASFVTEFSTGIVIVAFNLVILRLVGEIGIASYAIVANISLVFLSVLNGVGQAIQPLVSVNFGAGNLHRIRRVLVLGATTALVIGALGYLICQFFAAPIIGAFNSTGDTQLAAMTRDGFWRYFISLMPLGLNIVIATFFQSVLSMRVSLVVSTLRGLIFILPSIFLLSFSGLNGVWFAPVVAEIATLAVALFFAIRWMKLHAGEEETIK